MQIISTGRLPGQNIYQSTCRNCGTIFQFSRSEAKEVVDQRDGNFLLITCPLAGCGHHVTTSVDRQPNYAQRI